MTKVITAQMMSDLTYNFENQALTQKVEVTKDINNDIKVFNIVLKNYDASAILNKIKEHRFILAGIESKENHVPLVRANQAFARAVAVQPTALIHKVTIERTRPSILWATRHFTIATLIKELMLAILCKDASFVLHVDSRREKLVHYLAELLEWEMEYNSEPKTGISIEHPFDGIFSMFVFRSSDLEASIDCLNQSIGDPSGENKIRQIYVQESALSSFKTKLQQKLNCYTPEVLNDPSLQQKHEEMVKIFKKLNASTIRPLNTSEDEITPVVCYEFDLSYFPLNSPVVILKVFRTAKEAVTLAKKDKIRNASIWTESLALAYELVNSLECRHFWINCLGVGCKMWTELAMLSMDNIVNSGVTIENSYHFEYLLVQGFPKFIVFPFGVTFAN